MKWNRGRNKHAHEMGNVSGVELIPLRNRLKDPRSGASEGFEIVNRVSTGCQNAQFEIILGRND